MGNDKQLQVFRAIHGRDGRSFAEDVRLLRKIVAVLADARAFVPLHRKLLARAEGVPGRIGHDGDAGREAAQIIEEKSIAHAGQFFHLIEVGADGLAAENRAFHIRGVKHARQLLVNAKERLAGDDFGDCPRRGRACRAA